MLEFIKKEAVLCISFCAAVISMIFVPPCGAYADYIDWSVIMLLFCLMTAVQSFSAAGYLDKLSAALVGKIRSTRTLGALLSLMCFFLAMLVTNDVALLTAVPLTIMLFRGREEVKIRTIILETAAANLGSMATPMGNPQNLFIYSHYNMPLGEFFGIMLPPTIVSLVLLGASVFLIPNEEITPESHESNASEINGWRRIFCPITAIVCILTVVRVLNPLICLAVVVLSALICKPEILLRVDYGLLATFICFFVFVGNISALSPVKAAVESVLEGNEMLVGALLSQIISNVPCAVMLAGFTQNAGDLLLGVNLGGLGTLIASLASLISFKLYINSEGAKKGRYFLRFTVYNFLLLAVLYAAQIGINLLFSRI